MLKVMTFAQGLFALSGKHPILYAKLEVEVELPKVCKTKVVVHVFVAICEEWVANKSIVFHVQIHE